MKKQYFEFDGNGLFVGSLFTEYNASNPKPNNVTDIQPPEGLYKAKFNGDEWVETMDPALLTQGAITSKLLELNQKCKDVIFAGADVTTSEGVKHFSLTEVDQLNITGLSAELEKALGGKPSKVDLSKGVPYHADGELCKFWSVEDFTHIVKSVTEFILYHQTYVNHLREFTKRSVYPYDIGSITYGMALPGDLQSSLDNLLGIA